MYKHFFKRFFDFTITLVGLIAISPILLVLCLLVRIKLGTPIFFPQIRIGKDEKPFKMLKFRTMTDDRDEEGNLLPDEQRFTKFGNFLRNSSLDELPELINVLKGDMSLVGPRPLYPFYLPYYYKEENLRHTVRGGITGLAQINGRALCRWDDRFAYDVKYVKEMSLWNDIKILWRTVFKVAGQDDIGIPSVTEEGGLHIVRELQQPEKVKYVEEVMKKYGGKNVPHFDKKQETKTKKTKKYMKNKRLMILGTNEYQNPVIVRAKELGYETHVYGLQRGEIGERTADYFHPVDVCDFDKMWEEVEKLNPCGIVSICSELVLHTMNYLLRKRGIPCNSEWTEKISTDKYLMRKAMKDGGVDSPNFMLVTDKMSIEEIYAATNEFSYPLICKPVDLSSSRGVFKIENKDGLKEALDYALEWSKKKEVILEEFIEGPEYSGESIAYQGQYKLLAITEKQTTGAPHFVETGHRQPARLSDEMRDKVEQTLYKAFASMKIEYGAIHPEFRITPEGKIYFMEIATRMGGDCIGTDLTPLSSGYDFMGMVINICQGKAPDFTKIREPKLAEIHYIMTQADLDEYERVKREEPQTIWRTSDMKPISDKPVLKSADRAGYYITIK